MIINEIDYCKSTQGEQGHNGLKYFMESFLRFKLRLFRQFSQRLKIKYETPNVIQSFLLILQFKYIKKARLHLFSNYDSNKNPELTFGV